MTRLYDITRPVHAGMEVYPGDPEVALTRVQDVLSGAEASVSLLSLGTHTGTHVDPPRHLFPDGQGADELPLDALVGPAFVVEAPGVIDRQFLSGLGLEAAQRVLFKTSGSGQGWLDEGGALYLAGLGVRLVGIDTLSVDGPGAAGLPVHRALLRSGVVVLEGLDLGGVPPGTYELVCLPLRIMGGDGAPARAVLREVG